MTLAEHIDLVQKVVDEQSENSALWFVAETAAEAYLQKELRRLHTAIEEGVYDDHDGV